MAHHFPWRAILFDLDGTLVDTAPDLALALNLLLREEGREALPFAQIRPLVSYGSPALIRLGFGTNISEDYYQALRRRFLDIYEANIHVDSVLFPGIDGLLAALDAQHLPWGIVTNKPGYLTGSLLDSMGLEQSAACIVAGDTLAVKKPDPEPLWLAARQCGVDAAECVYIGDASRDIEAARNAGMDGFAAAYGYLREDEDPLSWNAAGVFRQPQQVLEWFLAGL